MRYGILYSDFLKSFLKIHKSIRIVFDTSNGSAGIILKSIFKDRRNTIFINDKLDGSFPAHGPDPLRKEARSDLQRSVIRHKADLGVIFDVDGDRAIFIDSSGRTIDQDVVGRLIFEYLKPKSAVLDLTCGWLLQKDVSTRVFRSRVGHYFIRKDILKRHAQIGLERSGHFYFNIKSGTHNFVLSSAILGAIHVISLLSYIGRDEFNYRISELSHKYFRWEKNITASGGVIDKIHRVYKKKNFKINSKDGLTVEGKDFWFNIRESKTEPLIRINIESVSRTILAKERVRILNSIGAI